MSKIKEILSQAYNQLDEYNKGECYSAYPSLEGYG